MKLQPFARKDLHRLIELEGGPHLSAFLPAPLRIHDGEQDRIRIGNLVREARRTLREYWMPESDSDKFLEPLRKFADDAVLAQPRTHSVAIFLSESLFEAFRIDTTLEYQWSIGRKFRIRSLLPELERLESYYVLTLSEKKVALFAEVDGTLEQQSVDGLQESFKEYEATFSTDANLQIHSSGARGSRKQGGVYHGHGGISDSESVDLENYLKHVDSAVNSFVIHHPTAPVVLAGVDSLTSMYRHVSHCEVILPIGVSGNVDQLSTDELGERVVAIAMQEHARHLNERAFQIREHEVPIETNSELILAAAAEGRINTLFINQDAELYGMFIADQGVLKELKHAPSGDPADASRDLIELAVAQTLKTGGVVHAVQRNEMPFEKAMVAALRF